MPAIIEVCEFESLILREDKILSIEESVSANSFFLFPFQAN